MNNPKKRFIQIYTGNGKGKTTAAIGQAIRSAGHGLKSKIIMFMKDFPYGELNALKVFEEFISIEQFGDDNFVLNKIPPSEKDLLTAKKALDRSKEIIDSGRYDIVIFDEICVACYFGLFKPEDIIPLLDNKPDDVELILTGRYCPEEWIEKADLVTEMKEVKHYYQQGIIARKGFES
ncbi:MAG: cob(I)yrinic acid a,c-diamide adenosyltransferase [candidate division Zixibacteria bacterium]|nr:cob(I)yrinic acid a,c-diamide adenosyltransferase [candidate division Zixibacteria bacterium]